MTIIRRSAGFATVFLSVIGLLLCIAGTDGVWLSKSRVDAIVTAIIGTADEAFEFMDSRLERVRQAIANGRERAHGLSTLTERLKETQAELDLSAEVEPLLQMLENVRNELQTGEQWLDAIQAIAGGVNRVSESIVASKAEEDSAAATASRVAEISAGVTDALARLEVMRQELVNLREKKVVAREFAAAMVTRVTELDAKLANLSERIDELDSKVSSARTSSVELGRSVHWWVTFAAVMLTLVGLWFALSQVCVMYYAWRFARHSPGKASPP